MRVGRPGRGPGHRKPLLGSARITPQEGRFPKGHCTVVRNEEEDALRPGAAPSSLGCSRYTPAISRFPLSGLSPNAFLDQWDTKFPEQESGECGE